MAKTTRPKPKPAANAKAKETEAAATITMGTQSVEEQLCHPMRELLRSAHVMKDGKNEHFNYGGIDNYNWIRIRLFCNDYRSTGIT